MEQKKKHSHTGHRQRFKMKALEGGIEHWPYHEVLELMLMYTIPQKDVNPLAHELINSFGTLGAVLDAGYEQLIKVKGVGHETALFLSLLPDMFLKYTASKNVDSVLMDTPQRSVRHFRNVERVKNIEEFYVFCLNNKKRLIKTIKFDSGLVSLVGFSITSFVQQIAFESNKSIVVMHSHPSGNSNPTSADIEATKQLIASCIAVGIKFDDHIIVTDKEYFSFLKSGLLKDLKQEIDPDDNESKI